MITTRPQTPATFRIGDLDVTVRSDLAGVVDDFEALYPGCRRDAPGRGRVIRMEIRRSGRTGLGRPLYTVHGDGEEIHKDLRRAEVLPHLEWGISWRVVARCTEYLQVHAASMERDGHGVVLAGDSGSGKTTLAAGLLARGWSYLCDEFALIHPETLQLHPYPKALCIKSGSFDVVTRQLGMRLAGSRRHLKGIKGRVGYISPEHIGARIAEPCPVSLVLFPSYHEDTPPRLHSMTRADAALNLAAHTLNRDVFGHRVIPLVGRVIRGARSFELESGPIEATCDLIESLMPGGTGQTGQTAQTAQSG